MTLTLDLPVEEETRLQTAAASKGVPVSEIIRCALSSYLPADETTRQVQKNAVSIALLQQWLVEDATNDPQEIAQAEADLTDFKRNMNAPRKQANTRLTYPEAE